MIYILIYHNMIHYFCLKVYRLYNKTANIKGSEFNIQNLSAYIDFIAGYGYRHIL